MPPASCDFPDSADRNDHAFLLALDLDHGKPVTVPVREVNNHPAKHAGAIQLAEDLARLRKIDVANLEGDTAPPHVSRIRFV